MNATAESSAKSTADRITIEVDWADSDGVLPATSSSKVLSAAIEAELKSCVAEGVYPPALRFERLVKGGLQGVAPMFPVVEVSAPDLETIFDFYTAYCGGDSGQAVSELEEFYGYEVPEGWFPRV